MPVSWAVLNNSAIVNGSAEARYLPMDGPVLNSEAIFDCTAEALVNRNKIYSGISHLPTGRVTSVTCYVYVGHWS
jgi:hypothetical protein